MAILRIDQFISTRQADWGELESLLRRVRGGNMRTLATTELERLSQLYRHATADLALARRDYPRDPVTAYLNRLVASAHPVIYYREALSLRRLVRFLSTSFPRLYREVWPYTLTAFLLFIIPALACFLVIVLVDERAAVTLLGPDQAYGVIDNFKRGEIWTKIPLPVRPAASAEIMTNNIRVIFFTLAGGMLFGSLTVYLLVFNGINLGTIMGLAWKYNMLEPLMSFIAGHGFIELSVIFLAGGVGLMLGNALLRPGRHSRIESLSLVAGKAIRLVFGGALLLVVAGLIEGFFSPVYSIPPIFHYLFSLLTGVVLYAYWLLAGRPPTHSVPRGNGESGLANRCHAAAKPRCLAVICPRRNRGIAPLLQCRTPNRKGEPVMRNRALSLLLTLCLLLSSSGDAVQAEQAGFDERYFPETGYSLVGKFLRYWQDNGGLDRFGYPLGEVFRDAVLGLDVQYLERGRLEMQVNAAGEASVTLGRLGAELITAEQCTFPTPSTPIPSSSTAPFPQTGYAVSPMFLDYWQTRGGLASYGYPLSPAYTDKGGMLVQWFERARFELHPQNPPPYNVLLSPLGRDQQQRRAALLPYLRVRGDKLVFGADDQPFLLKGVNYSPSQHPWRLWREWDEPTVIKDFALMRNLGSNTVRVFVTLEDWQQGYFSPARMERLLQIASANGIRPIVSLFDSYLKYPTPGWDNWPTAADDPRVPTELAYLRGVVAPYALDTRIIAWDILNEADYVVPYTEWVWNEHAANRLAWLRRIATYIRTLDRVHPLSVGLTTHYGLLQPTNAAAELNSIVDYVSFHYYEHNYYTRDLSSLLTEMRGYTDKPLLVEEIGHPSGGTDLPNATEDLQRAFYAKMLPQAAQSAGALAWSLLDWPSLSGSEANFGLYRADYSAKPAAAVFRDALTVAPFPVTNPSAGVPLFCANP